MKLNRDRIVDAGMALLPQSGIEGLSMRLVAQRLDTQAGSLYYHVPSRAALLRLMADRVAQRAYDDESAHYDDPSGHVSWQEQVERQLIALRASLLAQPGGALLLALSPKIFSTGALSLMERLLETLSTVQVPAYQRAIAADTLLSYVTGFVLQEQAESGSLEVSTETATDLAQRFPLTIAAATGDEDQQFLDSIRLICHALHTRATES